MVEFSYNKDNHILTCSFPSRLDSMNSNEIGETIKNKLDELLESDHKKPTSVKDFQLIFNLEGVEYIASSFMRICLANAKRFPASKLSIINTLPQIKKVFKIAGLDKVMDIV
ncbi:MAG: STAS domain-containing protein [Candidatus Cloacimonetes bacterium]|nr:STAS domain-containing protein [Candidatus Cloacimonadota bacterium]